MGEGTCGARFHVYRGNVSPPQGKKPIFVPLSKSNTGMAVLRAGLPVIIWRMACNINNDYLTGMTADCTSNWLAIVRLHRTPATYDIQSTRIVYICERQLTKSGILCNFNRCKEKG